MATSEGYESPLTDDLITPPSEDARAETQRAGTHDRNATNHPTAIEFDKEAESADETMQDMVTSDSDSDEDAAGEEDGEFDIGTPPRDNARSARGSSLSSTSSGALKRKPSLDDEEFMQQNPELYGLRRSGRARPSRRVVDSDDDESASDVNTGRPRKRLKSATTNRQAHNHTVPTIRRQPSASASEDDTYGGARGRDFARSQRRKLQAASDLGAPSLAEVRFSARRAAKVANYNEDENDPFLEEEDSENVTPNYWAAGAEDDAPSIDIVLNHRLLEGKEAKHADKHDFEFFIKWQGKAHHHATWEPWSALTSYRGFRRLENYYRKTVRPEQEIMHDPYTPPEEREKWILDREAYIEALDDYMKIERVIGAREGEEEDTEYYVKWRGLPYDNCTWENESMVSQLAQHEIDRYLDRSSKLPTSDKREGNLATRSTYKPFRSQPDYIKYGQLREFQIAGLNFLAHNWCKGNNIILADEMGLGKTVQTVSFMNWLRHDRGQDGPFIVVVPLSTMPAWADTFNNWTPDVNYVVYNGNEASRRIIQDYELLVDGNPKKVKFHVLLTTYEYILLDTGFLSSLKWQFMAVDEAHRLKNRESQLYAKLMDFGVPSRLLITGTPMQNNLTELSALMEFLMPGVVTVDDDIDLASDTAKQKIDELTKAITPYMIRRTKAKVESDLPPKTEKIIRVELSDVQLEYYKNILTRNYAALNQGATGQKQSLLNIMMELKKASNHPFMFPNAEDRILAGSDSRDDQLKGLITSSGKMMLLDQLLTKMKKDNHRVLIFSQMVKMLDILGDYLHLRGHQFQRLDGTIAAGPRRQAIDHFNAPDSKDFCFILSTRAGGLGINLMTADTVILFDSDWNPQADLQAMARAHRIGQKNPVTIYRLVSKDTVEEEVLERARNKLMLEFITIHRAITDKDAKSLNDTLARAGVSTVEPNSSDDISRILKRRGQKMFEQSGNQKKLEELDIDAVLANAEEHKTEQDEGITADGGEEFLRSFEYTDVKVDLEWDEIIPKEALEKIKEDEKRKEDEKYLESVIEMNQPRKRKAPADEAREQRAAKKRARDLAAQAVADEESEEESPANKKDPKRPLNEKEIRNLIRAFEKYGSIDEREDELIREARLVGRDVELLKTTIHDIVDTSHRLLKEEADRVLTLERESNKPVTKKDKKAVLFDYGGVKRLNAETLTERPVEMRILKDVVAAIPDWRSFRVPEASKPAHYTADWGAREDGMLCVGISKHGYGAWVAIRDDPELGMTEKFYLEEHRVGVKEERDKAEVKEAKSPGAVHLVRRANYLLSVLKDKTSNGTNIAAKRALENHHRNNKKFLAEQQRRLGGRPGSVSASPAPGPARKLAREESHRHRGSSQNEHRNSVDRRFAEHSSSPKQKHRKLNGEHTDRTKQHKAEDGKHVRHAGSPVTTANGGSKGDPSQDEHMRRLFKPIREGLVRIATANKHHTPDDTKRLKLLKIETLNLGNHIKMIVRNGTGPPENQLWTYIAQNHWPQAKKMEKLVKGSKIKELYEKMSAKEASAATTKADPNVKRQANGDEEANGEAGTKEVAPKKEDSEPLKEEETAVKAEERTGDQLPPARVAA